MTVSYTTCARRLDEEGASASAHQFRAGRRSTWCHNTDGFRIANNLFNSSRQFTVTISNWHRNTHSEGAERQRGRLLPKIKRNTSYKNVFFRSIFIYRDILLTLNFRNKKIVSLHILQHESAEKWSLKSSFECGLHFQVCVVIHVFD